MPTIRVSDEVYHRLQEYADGRPLGKAIERLLEADKSGVLVRPPLPAGGNTISIQHIDETDDPPFAELGRVPAPPAGSVDAPPSLFTKGNPKLPKGTDRARPLDCTCGSGEKAKGKHSKWCPVRVT